MRCQNCGNEMGEDDRFCNRCGFLAGYSQPANSRGNWGGKEEKTEKEGVKPPEKRTSTAWKATIAIAAAGLIVLIVLVICVESSRGKARDVLERWSEESQNDYQDQFGYSYDDYYDDDYYDDDYYDDDYYDDDYDDGYFGDYYDDDYYDDDYYDDDYYDDDYDDEDYDEYQGEPYGNGKHSPDKG